MVYTKAIYYKIYTKCPRSYSALATARKRKKRMKLFNYQTSATKQDNFFCEKSLIFNSVIGHVTSVQMKSKCKDKYVSKQIIIYRQIRKIKITIF